MAHMDPRLPLLTVSLNPESDRDPIQAKVDRLFAELAREMGLAEPDLLPQNNGEECMLVYDKFSGRRR